MEYLGRYELMKQIAVGGMAQIFVAKQTGVQGFEKLVVIKLLLQQYSRNPELVRMFLGEARIAARLNHPNVVQIYDLGYAAGKHYIAMEFIHGENLDSILRTCRKRGNQVPIPFAIKIISQALEGLHYAHTKTDVMGKPLNIVHCDVSPQNVLVSFDGVVKLVDFGIAKAASLYAEEKPEQIRGKVAYMSPEHIQGVSCIDSRSDLFSLGVVFWELLTGKRYYGRAAKPEIVHHIQTGQPKSPRESNSEIPVELERIVLQSLERDPKLRFQSALQMHSALEKFTQAQGLVVSTFQVGAFMQEQFKDKMDSLRQIFEAQAAGKGLESFLFDDLETSADSGSDIPVLPSEPTPHPASHATPLKLSTPKPLLKVKSQDGILSAERKTPLQGKAPPKKSRWLWLVVIFLILTAIAGLGYLFYPQLVALFHHQASPLPSLADHAGKGGIRVFSDPAGAAVSVDGLDRGNTPCEVGSLDLGAVHVLNISAPGRIAWSNQFKVDDPTKVEEFHVILKPLPKPQTPAPENKTPGVKKPVPSPPSEKRDRANQDLEPSQAPSEPQKKAQTPEAVQPTGTLRLNTSPWTEILLKGKKLGVTPLLDVELPAGQYTLEAVNPEAGIHKEISVLIKAGERTTLSVKF
jgi:eukaryotic-like serine/threonine-protein kinase